MTDYILHPCKPACKIYVLLIGTLHSSNESMKTGKVRSFRFKFVLLRLEIFTTRNTEIYKPEIYKFSLTCLISTCLST